MSRANATTIDCTLCTTANALNGTRYYEWLKKGKERLPHFTKRQDGQLMLLAGLYDRAQLEGLSVSLVMPRIVVTQMQERVNLCGRSPL